MERYNHQAVEAKWQKLWDKEKTFAANDSLAGARAYVLDMFPYPSAQGLHVGHPEGYTATDIYCRYLRLTGVNVLHPMGWDAFGLPAENYAIKTGRPPREVTWQNIDNFRRQIKSLGFSYDWSREVNTADPSYYKWTQWLFLKFYEKGLAYRKSAPVNWCPGCQTVLANEQVVAGECERCGSQVEQRQMAQWFLKITDYAERLLADLVGLDWPEPIIEMQKNWIGKSAGAEVDFPLKDKQIKRFVLLHGRTASSTSHFFPGLKAELEKQGYEVRALDLPNTDLPDDIEQAEFVKNNCKLDEYTVIVGHSMGGIVALRLLEQGIKVNKVILIGMPLTGEFLDKKDRPSVLRACQKDFDFKTIQKNALSFVVLGDTKDYVVAPKEAETLADKLGTKAKLVKATAGHFCSAHEPEILVACLNAVKIFTTRLDTIFGATYLVLAPEHPLIASLLKIKNQKSKIKNAKEVEEYIRMATKKTELERKAEVKDKTGIELEGVTAINPATQEEIPVFIADYVLMGYGTGAIMAVPAHDERDFAFAKKFNLSIKFVIAPYFKYTQGKEALHENEPVVHRRTANSFVKHWSENKYLCLDWPKYDWRSGIIGGVDDNESLVDGAVREIKEETGYQNLHLIKKLPIEMHSHFFATHKNENRYAVGHYFLFQLVNDVKKETKEEDIKNHEPVWVDGSKMKDFLNLPNFNLFWQMLQTGNDCFSGQGVLVESGEFSGLTSSEATIKIADKIGAKLTTQYRLRDWLISRQRYWGAPIPIVYCEKCGQLPVPEKDLPVLLPEDVDFKPTGESPLALSKLFQQVNCPKCGASARRESDTMDTFVDSSWYFLRYTDPNNQTKAFAQDKIKHWLPVNFYVGGAEHAVMHLLYARFFTKVLNDLGYLNFVEPFLKLRNQGLILGEDGQKMSKSRGNVINPDEIVEQYGADTFRLYEMFMGPLEDAKPWNTSSIIGMRRFLERVWDMAQAYGTAKEVKITPERLLELRRFTAQTIKKVTDDIKDFRFNTAISALMRFTNQLQEQPVSQAKEYETAVQTLLVLLYSFVPHITAELWQNLGFKKYVWEQPWPTYNKQDFVNDFIVMVVQVNGKTRASIDCPNGAGEVEITALVKNNQVVARHLAGKNIKRVIYVAGKLINFVTGEII